MLSSFLQLVLVTLTGYQGKSGRHPARLLPVPSCSCSLGPSSADVFMKAFRNCNFMPQHGNILHSDWCGNKPAVCILDGCKAVSWHIHRAVATSMYIIISAMTPHQTHLHTHTQCVQCKQRPPCLAWGWGFQAEGETKQEKSMVC